MDKISGIIPSSSRVASVDMRDAPPVRPGTPSFGRPEGVSSLRDAKIGQTAARAGRINQERLDWKSKDMQNAAVAREMSDRFFGAARQAAPETLVDVDTQTYNLDRTRESKPTGFNTSALDRVTSSAAFAGGDESDFEVVLDDSNSFANTIATRPDAQPMMAASSTAKVTENALDRQPAEQPEGLHPLGSFLDVRA